MIAIARTWTVGWWVPCYRHVDEEEWLVYHRWIERKRFKGRRSARAYLQQERIVGVRHPSSLVARRLDDLTSQPDNLVTDKFPTHQFIGGEQ